MHALFRGVFFYANMEEKVTREQARHALGKKSDSELLKAYNATQSIDRNMLTARADHILCMFYLEFELTHRGLPMRSSMKIGW